MNTLINNFTKINCLEKLNFYILILLEAGISFSEKYSTKFSHFDIFKALVFLFLLFYYLLNLILKILLNYYFLFSYLQPGWQLLTSVIIAEIIQQRYKLVYSSGRARAHSSLPTAFRHCNDAFNANIIFGFSQSHI